MQVSPSDSEAESMYPEMHVSGVSFQPVTEVESAHEAVGNAEKTTTECGGEFPT